MARRSRSGPVATPRVYPKRATSERLDQSRDNLGTVATEFPNLTDAQIAAWNAWGASRTKTNDVNGKKYGQTGINAFVELGSVFKMASPGVATPTMPPTTGYAGDSLAFSMATSLSTLTVTGSGPTSAGTLLEISVARLASRARKIPTEGYVSQGFFALEVGDGNLAEVTLPAGVYAVRVRYVKKATGQTTVAQILGKATVALSTVMGGVDEETGEVFEPKARAPRMRKAA